MDDVAALQNRLIGSIAEYESCLVAYSGGVDSAVVAQAAHLALGPRAVAVTASSASLAAGELASASELARQIGIRHEVISTGELANPSYTRNAPNRCYHCKSELYSRLAPLASQLALATIANGANTDDRGDYRPGTLAANEYAVRSPLLECGFDKETVRRLAAAWQLPVWDKPATPCLSSRIAYGEEVTPGRLQMIDAAEQTLRALGLREVRVRYHRGDLARIEVPLTDLPRLAEASVRATLVSTFEALGFRYITLDLAGFRSGSLNSLVDLDALRQSTTGQFSGSVSPRDDE